MGRFIEIISPIANGDVLALCIISFLSGALITVLDSILFRLRGSSLLQIEHNSGLMREILTILLWSFASAIVGLLGGVLRIFNTDAPLQTSIFIAVSWPLIFRNLIKSQGARADNSQG